MKMQTLRIRETLVAAACLACCAVFAQSVPTLINYQGRLTDQVGAPLPAGTYTIQFRVWDSATLANPPDLVWGQQQNLTVQSNGVFNAILGAPGGSVLPGTSPAVNNLAYAFAGTNCFLGVTVTVANGIAIASPTEILPRQQLLSVPFAMLANAVGPGAIQTTNLADGAVTLSKMAAREIGQNVGFGGLALSMGTGPATYYSPTAFVDVTNLQVSLQTTGRPVHLFLIPDDRNTNSDTPSALGIVGSSGDQDVYIGLYMDSDDLVGICNMRHLAQPNASPNLILHIPPSAVQFLVLPASGMHTFRIKCRTSNTSGNIIQFLFVKLFAVEL